MEKICPRCGKGLLEEMTTQEKIIAGLKEDLDILGCDECLYYEYE